MMAGLTTERNLMNETDILLDRIRAQVESLGVDGAIALYSNPKSPKKVTARQLQAIIAGEQEPTLRMARVELERAKGLVDNLHSSFAVYEAQTKHLHDRLNEVTQDNVRLRLELDARPVSTVGTATDRQGFVTDATDSRAIAPAQPVWAQNARKARPVQQPWANASPRNGVATDPVVKRG